MIKLTKPIRVSKLCKIFNLNYHGKDKYIYGFGSIFSKKKNILCFSNYEVNLTGKILIQKRKNNIKSNTSIINKNPRLLF